MITYAWQGIEDAVRRIERLRMMTGLDTELEAEGDAMLPILQDYPPERPGQRYRRTYSFQRGWKRGDAKRTGGTIEVDLGNAVPYGPFVVGDDQAEVHRGRWYRLRTVVENRRGAVRARAQAWALRTWRGG